MGGGGGRHYAHLQIEFINIVLSSKVYLLRPHLGFVCEIFYYILKSGVPGKERNFFGVLI